jgi:hypothetical protein
MGDGTRFRLSDRKQCLIFPVMSSGSNFANSYRGLRVAGDGGWGGVGVARPIVYAAGRPTAGWVSFVRAPFRVEDTVPQRVLIHSVT